MYRTNTEAGLGSIRGLLGLRTYAYLLYSSANVQFHEYLLLLLHGDIHGWNEDD